MNDMPSSREPAGIWPLTTVLFVWVLIVGLSVLAYRPPEPRPASIPPNQFSAIRAESILQALVGDAIPHPAGSPQNKVVRGRIVSLLQSFGYEVEIQSRDSPVAEWARDRSANKERVELHNIIAKRTGTKPGKAVMLVSHYDSVAAGPGASDDGVGTAALLEVARMIALEPDPKHDIVFLITDGEELGMLGAKLFANEHKLAKQIGIAINLEARGTIGPSCMFETSRMSRMLIPVFAGSNTKQFASSLFYEVYKKMPNDTDFSVFKKNGILGFNFAFMGNVRNYHTAADNFENADRGSLQHHGDNAIGLIRELQQWEEWDELVASNERTAALDSESTANEAVYFDVFGKWIVWWPGNWSIWLSFVAFSMFAVSSWQFQRAGRAAEAPTDNYAVGLALHFVFLLLTFVSVFAVGYLIQLGVRQDPRLSNPWPLQPVPVLLGFWFAGVAIVCAMSLTFSKWLIPLAVWNATCMVWLLLASASSVMVTGASHLFVAPIFVATGLSLLGCGTGRRGLIAAMVLTPIAVGFIWLPMERLFYDAVGFKMPLVMLFRISMLSALLLGPLALAGNRVRFAFAILMSILSVGSFVIAILFNAG